MSADFVHQTRARGKLSTRAVLIALVLNISLWVTALLGVLYIHS